MNSPKNVWYRMFEFDEEELPSPKELKASLPLQGQQRHFIRNSRQSIKNILDKLDPRLLIILGPCSIHDLSAAKEYAIKLKQLSEKVSDTFQIVMRTYFEKPRTSLGWKGFLYDPFLDGSNAIPEGLFLIRKCLLELSDLEIPTATEFLDPIAIHYFSDLISWGSIGARTAASQPHRQLASAIPMPVGFKNDTDGNLDVAINALVTASAPHTFLGINQEGSPAVIQSRGNPHTHLILRGGENKPNYDSLSIANALRRLRQAQLPLHLLVDCSHDNSNKKYDQQATVLQSVVQQVLNGNKNIVGMILESHLFAGSQMLHHSPERLKYGVSLTDPCLDWNTTEQLITWAYEKIKDCDSATDCRAEASMPQEVFAR